MTAPTKHQAYTMLVFVGAASVSVLVASLTIWAVSYVLDIDIAAIVEWAAGIVMGILGGLYGTNVYRARKKA
jgi:hypothetical protein